VFSGDALENECQLKVFEQFVADPNQEAAGLRRRAEVRLDEGS
jgi:hypothetical protein